MPFLQTAHHRLHYVTAGNCTHPSLLLLHGFLGSHQDFLPLLPIFSQYFYCIVPDLPGHGQTQTALDGYTFEETANSLLSLLRHFNIEQTHLLGYSMGGRLALYLVCEFPDYFVRVVLESASPGLKTAEERAKRREWDSAIAHRLQTMPLRTFLDQWYRNPLFASLHHHPDKYADMLQRRMQNNADELAKALQGLGTGEMRSLWPDLGKMHASISQPMLLVVGSLDSKFVSINREMAATLGQRCAQLTVVENCGHNLHLEAPVTYSRRVLRFLMPDD
ncbi:MAG: 2-succinyl-6-hydroxy-2,4-cyclohexadiene-1-carboxylate synthase [Cyanobacteria bacterium J06632_3]